MQLLSVWSGNAGTGMLVLCFIPVRRTVQERKVKLGKGRSGGIQKIPR